MLKTSFARALGWAMAAPLLGALPLVLSQEVLKDRDHQSLGEGIADYFEAKRESDGISEARDDLRSALLKIGKKHADRKASEEQQLQAALSLSADLGKALYYATDYGKTARGVKGGKVVVNEDFEFNGFKFPYAVHAPKKYKAASGPYPLLLCIPGLQGDGNQRAQDHITEDWINSDLRDSAVIVAIEMPERSDPAERIAAWTALFNEDRSSGGVAAILSVLRDIRENYAVDPERTYLSGRGPGALAAMEVAAMYPHVFAGVIARSGDIGTIAATNFRNLPTLLTGGSNSTAFQEACAEAGHDNCMIKADLKEEDIIAWIGEHARDSNPTGVSFSPTRPFSSKAYWLAVPPGEKSEGSRISAEVDRESNTITVVSEKIDRVTLFFNDQIVDLSKPITITLNGDETQQIVPRDFAHALELAFIGTSDAGRFYVAERSFDIAIESGN